MHNTHQVPLLLELYKTASLQNGFFTTLQAKNAGYKAPNFRHYINRGYWEQVARKVYRLKNYPLQEDGQYTLWSLWTHNRQGNPQGVISHISALGFYDLSDVVPDKIDMTVPSKFRPSSIPKILRLHKGIIGPNDIEERAGFLITKPSKTILDIASKRMIEDDHLIQAIENAVWRGWIKFEFFQSHGEFAYILPYIKSFREKII